MSTGTDQALSFAAPLYPIDKVVYRPTPTTMAVSQNANPLAPVFNTATLVNPLGYTFFIDLQVSPDGGTNWYDSGNEPGYFDIPHATPFRRFIAYWTVTATTVTIAITANDAAYTMQVRYVGVSKE